MTQSGAPYPDRFFEREDSTNDARFYDWPRMVVHIDEGAITALRNLYAEVLPTSGSLLDLMSSWRSHLPDTLLQSGLAVTGLGMNAEEMAANPQLADHVVHDPNAEPTLPFPDEAFDAAVCAVSVQYMTRPVEIFTQVGQVLKPGAPFIVSFSNQKETQFRRQSRSGDCDPCPRLSPLPQASVTPAVDARS